MLSCRGVSRGRHTSQYIFLRTIPNFLLWVHHGTIWVIPIAGLFHSEENKARTMISKLIVLHLSYVLFMGQVKCSVSIYRKHRHKIFPLITIKTIETKLGHDLPIPHSSFRNTFRLCVLIRIRSRGDIIDRMELRRKL